MRDKSVLVAVEKLVRSQEGTGPEQVISPFSASFSHPRLSFRVWYLTGVCSYTCITYRMQAKYT